MKALLVRYLRGDLQFVRSDVFDSDTVRDNLLSVINEEGIPEEAKQIARKAVLYVIQGFYYLDDVPKIKEALVRILAILESK